MSTQTLFVNQGTDFSTNLILTADDGTPINAGNYVYAGSIRQNPFSVQVSANFITTINDAANGNVSFSIPASNTANIAFGTYVYTITQFNGNTTNVLLSGEFIVLPSALVEQPLPPNVTPTFLDDTFYALSGQNSFYLSYEPANTANVLIVYNSTPLVNSSTIYTLTGNILVFANSANQGDVIQAIETSVVSNSNNTVSVNPRVYAYYNA